MSFFSTLLRRKAPGVASLVGAQNAPLVPSCRACDCGERGLYTCEREYEVARSTAQAERVKREHEKRLSAAKRAAAKREARIKAEGIQLSDGLYRLVKGGSVT
jgi:hypothetical protein